MQLCGAEDHWKLQIKLVRRLSCDWNRHMQEGSPEALWAQYPKSLKKVFPGLPARSVKKASKSPKEPEKSQKAVKIRARGLFRHFFDTPGDFAREDLFETFWRFRGSGAWRLLYMAVPIIKIVLASMLGWGIAVSKMKNKRSQISEELQSHLDLGDPHPHTPRTPTRVRSQS